MAKAIHWPAAFKDEVLAEPTDRVFCAFRLGAQYYEHRFWVDQEEVDIRVDHKVVRRAVVQGDLEQIPFAALTASVLAYQKQALQTLEAVRTFLSDAYQQPINDDTPITVVYYQNLPLDPDLMEG
jgi:hypothetical protein